MSDTSAAGDSQALETVGQTVERPLDIVVVEDRADDAELMALRLRSAGMRVALRRVETQAQYLAALSPPPDVILADWALPQFSGLRALEIYREHGLDVPFIVVSGSIGEEAAVDALHRGAFDYVLKTNLGRLADSIQHALEDRRLRAEYAAAAAALRASEERFRLLAENAQDIIYRIRLRPDRGFDYVSPAATSMTGYTPEDHYADPDLGIKLVHPDDRHLLLDVISGGAPLDRPLVLRWVCKDGGTIWTEQRNVPVFDDSGELVAMEGIARDVTERMEAAEALAASAERLRATLHDTVRAMGAIMELRDPYTGAHQRRVTQLAVAMAEVMGLSAEQLEGLRLAGEAHDAGKIGVPAEILSRPGKLSPMELGLMQRHPEIGCEILSGIKFEQPVAAIVAQHHERLDGSGYPNGLKGDEILLEARILAVADVVEAMVSHRPYRAALGMDAALAEVREGAGIRYDAGAVAACEEVMAAGFVFTE